MQAERNQPKCFKEGSRPRQSHLVGQLPLGTDSAESCSSLTLRLAGAQHQQVNTSRLEATVSALLTLKMSHSQSARTCTNSTSDWSDPECPWVGGSAHPARTRGHQRPLTANAPSTHRRHSPMVPIAFGRPPKRWHGICPALAKSVERVEKMGGARPSISHSSLQSWLGKVTGSRFHGDCKRSIVHRVAAKGHRHLTHRPRTGL